MFKNHGDRVKNYISNSSIGYERVERILDAAHAIRYHTSRIIGFKELSREEKKDCFKNIMKIVNLQDH